MLCFTFCERRKKYPMKVITKNFSGTGSNINFKNSTLKPIDVLGLIPEVKVL